MLRLALVAVFFIVFARAFWRFVDGLVEGLTGQPPGGRPPARRIAMERDPVCGTFVVPDHAVRLADGSRVVYFCSTRCRDAYRARTA